MTVAEVVANLGLTVASAGSDCVEVTGAVVTDLLSEVLAHGAPGQLWVTIQTHRNVVAVASTQELAAVVVAGGRELPAEVLALADRESVALLTSPDSAYTVAGRLYELKVR